jgi:hypothetical protein
MNPFLRRLFFTYCDEASDGTTGAPGGAAPSNDTPAGNAAATGDAPASVEPVASTPKTPEEVRVGMREKIDELIDGNKSPEDKKAAADKAAADSKAAADAKVAGDAKAKPKDDKAKPDLHKMPEGLKPESQSRFRELSNEVKTLSKRAETAETAVQQHVATINGFRDILQETRTSAEELSQLLEYNRMIKTGDLENAMRFLDQQRAEIARFLGRPVDGVDLLAGHPDLAQDVAGARCRRSALPRSPARAPSRTRSARTTTARRKTSKACRRSRRRSTPRSMRSPSSRRRRPRTTWTTRKRKRSC